MTGHELAAIVTARRSSVADRHESSVCTCRAEWQLAYQAQPSLVYPPIEEHCLTVPCVKHARQLLVWLVRVRTASQDGPAQAHLVVHGGVKSSKVAMVMPESTVSLAGSME